MGQRRYDGIRIRLQWRAEPDADPDPIAYADAYSGTHTNADSKTYADANAYSDTRAFDDSADLDFIRRSKGEPLEFHEFGQAEQLEQFYGDDQFGQAGDGYGLHDCVVNLHRGQNAGQGGVVHGRSEIHST